MRQPLVAGNWKMNGTLAELRPLIQGIKRSIAWITKTEVVVCPPFVYLAYVAEKLRDTPIRLGAQNLSHESAGAFTGEVSGLMLKDYNCKYVIVGHSERRTLLGENDSLVAKKFVHAKNLGLTPILCVGELLAEREAGRTEEVVERQLKAVFELAGVGAFRSAVVAYEPVWAIGTGRTATPEQAHEVHNFIRQFIAVRDSETALGLRILYGGSVQTTNARGLFAMTDIDGGLIGSASLEADKFMTICRAAEDTMESWKHFY